MFKSPSINLIYLLSPIRRAAQLRKKLHPVDFLTASHWGKGYHFHHFMFFGCGS
jgi:hypothetical protein